MFLPRPADAGSEVEADALENEVPPDGVAGGEFETELILGADTISVPLFRGASRLRGREFRLTIDLAKLQVARQIW